MMRKQLLSRARSALVLLLSVTLLAASATGCTPKSERPSYTVEQYMKTVVAMDPEAGNAYLSTPTSEGDLLVSGKETQLPVPDEEYRQDVVSALQTIYGSIEYEVKSAAVIGEEADVELDVRAPGLVDLQDYIMDLAFSEMDPAQLDLEIAELLLSELQLAASGQSGRVIHSVRLQLRRIDGEWKILNPAPVGHAVIGNISGLIMPGADAGTY